MTSTSGTTLVARYPTNTMKQSDDTMGTMKLTGVGFFSASSSDRSTSAMTSSITAAAMMSWPVGVPRTPPSCRTFREMPIDVGARDAPTARHVLALMSKTSLLRTLPMASGTREPKNAT